MSVTLYMGKLKLREHSGEAPQLASELFLTPKLMLLTIILHCLPAQDSKKLVLFPNHLISRDDGWMVIVHGFLQDICMTEEGWEGSWHGEGPMVFQICALGQMG